MTDTVSKREDWTCVQTYVPPELHERIVRIAKKDGATIEYLVRKLIEGCLPNWESKLMGTGAGSGSS